MLQFFIYRYNYNRSALFRTEGTRLQIYRDRRWREFTVKGVNLGMGKPGYLHVNSNLTGKEYRQWFNQIAAMNANVIRIHNILAPEFYKAFYEYNMIARRPLYLLQGIWVEEGSVGPYEDAYDDGLNTVLFEQIKRTVDIIHGKAASRQGASDNSGGYNLNISPYVMGFILGREMDPEFIIATNSRNTQVMGFEGDYLYTENASPYEAWLAALGNYTVSYEQEKYGGPYRLVSWVNMPLTDPLFHFMVDDTRIEELSGVDFEHINITEKYSAGIFASYTIYPYDPYLIRYQIEFSDFVDNRGYTNHFEGYLNELRRHHTMPVLAAEFGIPVFRGSSSRTQSFGNSNAVNTEKEQGEYAAAAYDSMISAGFAGGIIFAWQDSLTAELSYGIMTFDPHGETRFSNDRLKESYTIMQEKYANY